MFDQIPERRVCMLINVVIEGQVKQYEQGISFEQIAEEYQEAYGGLIGLVSVNGKIKELFKRLKKDCSLSFFTLKDDIGNKTYIRTATMLFLKAVNDVFGEKAAREATVEFTVGNGYYINPKGNVESTSENSDKILGRMRELQAQRVPFMKKAYHLDDAMELFETREMSDKLKLFRYRRGSFVNIYEIDGYYDYYYGYMLPNAGYVKWFDVIPYEEGFMLLLPDKKEPTRMDPFEESRKLFKTLQQSEKWGSAVGLETVGDLNDRICNASLSELILVQEAEQERKIGEIAKEIVSRGGVKFIMIAGPSSSGKTSFSHRLSIQLRTLGKNPHPIG